MPRYPKSSVERFRLRASIAGKTKVARDKEDESKVRAAKRAEHHPANLITIQWTGLYGGSVTYTFTASELSSFNASVQRGYFWRDNRTRSAKKVMEALTSYLHAHGLPIVRIERKQWRPEVDIVIDLAHAQVHRERWAETDQPPPHGAWRHWADGGYGVIARVPRDYAEKVAAWALLIVRRDS